MSNATTTTTETTLTDLGALRQSTGVYLVPANRRTVVKRACEAVASDAGWTVRTLATPNGSAYMFER